MPVPEALADTQLNPEQTRQVFESLPYTGILYATDRARAEEPGDWPPYTEQRGHILRVGHADVTVNVKEHALEEFLQETFLRKRSKKYKLSIGAIDEFGALDETALPLFRKKASGNGLNSGEEEFARLIREKLATTGIKEIFIYVHGFKVNVENPILVSAQLQHFLSYQGVFIAYSWPASSSLFGYFGDMETTRYAGRNLRLFVDYLAENTDAEKIHIAGYSAGTRVVLQALHQISIARTSAMPYTKLPPSRIGQVLLVSSDDDRHVFLSAVAAGMLEHLDNMTVYLSERDHALGFLKWFLGRNRLGQLGRDDRKDRIDPEGVRTIRDLGNLALVNVSNVPGSAVQNGHAYLRKSPWVSTDILATLAFGALPEDRGLVREEDEILWRFPEDYGSTLKDILRDTAQRYRPHLKIDE